MGSNRVSKAPVAQGWGQHPGPEYSCAPVPPAAAFWALRRAHSPQQDQSRCRLDASQGQDPCWTGSVGSMGQAPSLDDPGGGGWEGGCPEPWAGTAPLQHHQRCSISEQVPKPCAASGQAERAQLNPLHPKLPPQPAWGSLPPTLPPPLLQSGSALGSSLPSPRPTPQLKHSSWGQTQLSPPHPTPRAPPGCCYRPPSPRPAQRGSLSAAPGG